MKARRASLSPLVLPGVLLLVLLTAALSVPWAGAAEDASWESCAACHDEAFVARFGRTVHGRLAPYEIVDGKTGCEACHGDATAHMDSGDPGDIRGLSGDTAEDVAKVCSSCHGGKRFSGWYGSDHQMSAVGCTDCHTIHSRDDNSRYYSLDSPETCYKCHEEIRGQVMYPSHHPIPEGKMTCVSCHEPHGYYPTHLKTDERLNDLCFNCHSKYQGPFIFEHAPVVEDCTICHAPHGAVANNLLVQNEPFLCLQCHEFHFHAAQDANETDPSIVGDPGFERPFGNPFLTRGFKVAFTTKCSQCHAQIHGSDLPSMSLPGQGKAFTR